MSCLMPLARKVMCLDSTVHQINTTCTWCTSSYSILQVSIITSTKTQKCNNWPRSQRKGQPGTAIRCQGLLRAGYCVLHKVSCDVANPRYAGSAHQFQNGDVERSWEGSSSNSFSIATGQLNPEPLPSRGHRRRE